MATQYAHVRAVLESATRALAIHEIGAEIWSRYRIRHADTAISARIREIRKDIEAETATALYRRTVISCRAGPKDAYHIYCIGAAQS